MSIAADPNLKTIAYGLAPGAVDDDLDIESEEMLVNMGPQHPSTHGVLRIVLRTDGETVLEATPHLVFCIAARRRLARICRTFNTLDTPTGWIICRP